jgi:multidrug efflux pump subunit AcrB
MLKQLPHGVKISITRSIAAAFEKYMSDIQWNEDKYDLEVFIGQWRVYTDRHSTWFDKVDESIKNDQSFHNELAQKINETIEKILSEEPTEEQIEQLNQLEKDLDLDVAYSCKAEAKYHIERLEKQLKKNSNN